MNNKLTNQARELSKSLPDDSESRVLKDTLNQLAQKLDERTLTVYTRRHGVVIKDGLGRARHLGCFERLLYRWWKILPPTVL